MKLISIAREFVELEDENESWKNFREKYKTAEVWSVIREKKKGSLA